MPVESGSAIAYAAPVYGDEEIQAVVKVLQNPKHLVAGHAVKAFEDRIAKLFNKRQGVMVNSGSSANLLALEVLDIPPGREVITPALTFATTVAPIIQKGLVPVFVDVLPGYYTANIRAIRAAIGPKTAALMIPSLIGNLPDWEELQSIAHQHHIWLVEDSCDTLGASYDGTYTGWYSDISTTSFYASHIITAAGSGGMACFKDRDLARKALVIANWGRESTLFGVYEQSEEIAKRLAGKIDDMNYDAKFIFSEVGYNLQATEISAVFGLEQLKRLDDVRRARQNNFKALYNVFSKWVDLFVLPQQLPKTDTAWMAFPLTIKTDRFKRYDLQKFLEEGGIQTRPIFTGNITRQPGFKAKLEALYPGRDWGQFPVADDIMRNGLLLGCHPLMTDANIAYIKDEVERFIMAH